MGLEADAGAILKIAGDAGGCDDNSDASEDGRMGIEGDAVGDAGDYDESGGSGPDGLDLDLRGRNACRDGSDGDGGEDGRMGQEADSGAVSEAEGDEGDVGATTATHVRTPDDAAPRPLVHLKKTRRKKAGRSGRQRDYLAKRE